MAPGWSGSAVTGWIGPQPWAVPGWGIPGWGYPVPPMVPPIILPPGRFHPVIRRPILSLRGRASPGLYALGLVVGIPGALVLAFLTLAPWFGWSVGSGAIGEWLAIEALLLIGGVGIVAAAVAQARQRRSDGWRDYRGPSPGIVLGALLVVILAAELPLAALLHATHIQTESAAGSLVLILVYLVAYLGSVHFLVVRPGALSWSDVVHPANLAPDPSDWSLARSRPVPGSGLVSRATSGLAGDVLYALALLPAAIFASGLLNLVLLAVLQLHASDLTSPVPFSSSGLDPLITFITIAVLVPVGEETFFRGFATNAWGRSLARNQAIVRGALVFAFVHVLNVTNTDPNIAFRAAAFNFGARIPVAMALSWLYMRRRSLVASATLHGAFNGAILLLSLAV